LSIIAYKKQRAGQRRGGLEIFQAEGATQSLRISFHGKIEERMGRRDGPAAPVQESIE
jgi:hypothetical protein